MLKLYLLEPEVAGELGQNTLITNRSELQSGEQRIPMIENLEYVFSDWLGDDLLTSFPVFIVTQKLADEMIENQLSGLNIGKVQIDKSELFKEINPNIELPRFVWLKPMGTVEMLNDDEVRKWSGHDLCLSQYGDLIVTEDCLTILNKYRMEYCDIKNFDYKA